MMASDDDRVDHSLLSGSAATVQPTHNNTPRRPRRQIPKPLSPVDDGRTPTNTSSSSAQDMMADPKTTASAFTCPPERREPQQVQQQHRLKNKDAIPRRHSKTTEMAQLCQRIATAHNAPLAPPSLHADNATSLDALFVLAVNGAYTYFLRLQELEEEVEEGEEEDDEA
ncbi:hypothetical protein LY76DRAFT_610244 [Colletotrichum caudatum]|nr:hypothetical protein LY76DRAFT_610244 [Colletotrichum caudatum]